MVKSKMPRPRSDILTNIKYIQAPNMQDATWKEGYIMEQQARENWEKNRLKRMQSATNYYQNSLSPLYIQPNPYVLNMRLVKDNFLPDTIMKEQAKNKLINRFTYYDPVLEGPCKRGTLYSGNSFFINLM